jgi:Asp-tRNA(Asn)/Glu-tRNA(Gln) amidotransferase A subunit family amidase
MDQIGVNARSVGDILLFDQALAGEKLTALHAAAKTKFDPVSFCPTSVTIGCPEHPFITDPVTGNTVSPAMLEKLESAKAVLRSAGFKVAGSDSHWPTPAFEKCWRENKGGSSRHTMASSLAQMAQFVYEYLDAPVSPKEVLQDCGQAGWG